MPNLDLQTAELDLVLLDLRSQNGKPEIWVRLNA